MARTLQDYQAAAQNPYGRALLDVIAGAEGADYNVQFGGGRFDTSKGWAHPRAVIRKSGYASDASGRYQFLSTTWDGVANQLGIKDFSPANQDAAAMRLIERRGVNLDDVMAGKVDATTLAKLAPEWASLPTAEGKSYYGQPVKKAADLLAKFTAAAKGAPPAAGAGFRGSAPAPAGGAATGGVSLDAGVDPYAALNTLGKPLFTTAPGAQSAEGVALAAIGAAVAAGGVGVGANAGLNYLAARAGQGREVQRMAGAELLGQATGTAVPAPAPVQVQPPVAATAPVQQPSALDGAGSASSGALPFKRSVSTSFDQGQPGIDLYWEDKNFRSVLPGRVKDIGTQGGGRGASGKGYGNYVVVESVDPGSGKPVDVLYGHLDEVGVTKGQQVGEGARIGKQGGTGRVLSQDGTIASIDFLEPAPAGSGSMKPFAGFDPLRRRIARRWSS